jgi:hypothetical protein
MNLRGRRPIVAFVGLASAAIAAVPAFAEPIDLIIPGQGLLGIGGPFPDGKIYEGPATGRLTIDFASPAYPFTSTSANVTSLGLDYPDTTVTKALSSGGTMTVSVQGFGLRSPGANGTSPGAVTLMPIPFPTPSIPPPPPPSLPEPTGSAQIVGTVSFAPDGAGVAGGWVNSSINFNPLPATPLRPTLPLFGTGSMAFNLTSTSVDMALGLLPMQEFTVPNASGGSSSLLLARFFALPTNGTVGYLSVPWLNSGWSNTTTAGNVSASANWVGGTPTDAREMVRFGPVNSSGTTTVSVDALIRTKRLLVDGVNGYNFNLSGAATNGIQLESADDGYARLTIKNGFTAFRARVTVTATSGLRLVADGAAQTLTFDNLLNASRSDAADDLAVSRRQLIKEGSTLVTLRGGAGFAIVANGGVLALSSSAAPLATAAAPVVTRVVSVANSATLNLNEGRLVINYNAVDGPGDIRGLLATSLARRWNTNTAGGALAPFTAVGLNASSNLAIGYIEASRLFPGGSGVWFNRTVDSTSLLLRTTLPGDATLDGTVNFDDLLALAANYNASASAAWYQGDYNYDGRVNFDDLLLLASNYNRSISGSFAGIAELAAAPSLVPEPGLAGAIFAGAVAALRRRRGEGKERA